MRHYAEYKKPWKPLNTTTERQCGNCGEVKPLTSDFFHKKGEGLSYNCKICACDIVKAKRKEKVDIKWSEMYKVK